MSYVFPTCADTCDSAWRLGRVAATVSAFLLLLTLAPLPVIGMIVIRNTKKRKIAAAVPIVRMYV